MVYGRRRSILGRHLVGGSAVIIMPIESIRQSRFDVLTSWLYWPINYEPKNKTSRK